MRAPRKTQDRARQLRREMTPPEARLWVALRARTADFPAFRRQHPVGPYILDFYCAKAKLAIEVDGWGHNMGDPGHDGRRDAWLRTQGIEVLRYPAASVMNSFHEVTAGIIATVNDRMTTLPPPSARP